MILRSIPGILSALICALAIETATAQHNEQAAQAESSNAADTQVLFTAEDMRFIQHMIVHHEQALVMSDLVPARSERAEFVRFAGYVERAQRAEIGLMQSLLDLAANRGHAIPEHDLHGDPPMAGMLSTAQMDALAAASGTEFERLWIEGMIHHHQGAIDMAHAQQRQQLATGRRPYGLDVLVEDIIEEQRAEIDRMQTWLREWGIRE